MYGDESGNCDGDGDDDVANELDDVEDDGSYKW